MLTTADTVVAGQPLTLKASTPMAALEEAMEYLIQNTFPKMRFLTRLSAEPLQEVQAVLRGNDIAKESLLLQTGEHNSEALDDLRSYLHLSSIKSQLVVLHDMLEKRYAVRPYGWPDEEVLLLLARLIVLSEISLMLDSTVLPIDKVYEAITTSARRRKIVVRTRKTSDPTAIQNARHLGKELFAEMGPDGEDGLCTFLQTKLRSWHGTFNGYKPLADTGDYPGGDEITHGLALINPLLADTESKAFIERFNALKHDLLDVADQYHDVTHFYDHQRPIWETAAQGPRRLRTQPARTAAGRPSRTRPHAHAGHLVGPTALRAHQRRRRPHQRGASRELVAAHCSAGAGHRQDRRPHRRAQAGHAHHPG